MAVKITEAATKEFVISGEKGEIITKYNELTRTAKTYGGNIVAEAELHESRYVKFAFPDKALLTCWLGSIDSLLK